MLVIYPAIFHKAIEGGYVVEFPDLNNGATQGETLEEAVEAAQDYIGTWLYDDFVKGNAIPKATDISEIQITDNDFIIKGESFKSLVSLDMKKYVNESKKQVVRKNVSIPSWLNEIAMNNNINFSNVLQKALKKELNL
ncbi:type II toxin-antitoxin system HicB family antitoxin [Pseudoleptotrichia goodfellowii]|uniref:Toxin-antitoxin system, antitoxin component, HicB family n=1 Tax=Pseudoleptotrichia goodfellowii TaxID=157692 RepID=A0A510J9P0_9FUSO|nr:type II toxin-antitoxin system HicB family antitoxin [Pseudoleptotrichia goodfellowii]BBM35874.1 toxin-antitoxin system, antitoxin component, HicB family [Pseudoleptotrichia goodfellowii]